MEISKRYTFHASHWLPFHEGKCHDLHGHQYFVEVTVGGIVNKPDGFVTDYDNLDMVMNPLIKRLDHKHLPCFIKYTTAENIATYIAYELQPWLNQLMATRLVETLKVAVSETSKTWAVWDSEDKADVLRLAAEPVDEPTSWRAPIVDVPVDINVRREQMAVIKHKAEQLFLEYEGLLTRYEHYRLFDESLMADVHHAS